MCVIEITVKIEGEDQTLTEKFLEHEEGLALSHEDARLSHMVAQTQSKFKGVIEDITIKAKYVW